MTSVPTGHRTTGPAVRTSSVLGGRLPAARVLGRRLLALVLAVPLLALLLVSNGSVAGASPASNWPQFLDGPGHPSYNPLATSITPAAVEAGNLQPVWKWFPPPSPNAGPDGFLASPTVVNGIVYIGDEDGYFYAINQATRAVLWSDFLGLEVNQPASDCGTYGVTATASVVIDPATGDLTVYVNAPDGYVYALNAATGAVVWQSVVGIPSTTENNYYAWGSTLVVNDTVYVGISSACDNPLVPAGVLAFNQSTGAQIAYWDSLPPGESGASVWSTPAADANGDIFATTGNGYDNSGQPLYNQSIVRLDGSTLQLEDSWQVPPSEQVTDGDFGGSPTLFTATIGGISTPMVGACNKDGIYYAFEQDDLSAGPVWQDQIEAPYNNATEPNQECDSAAIWNGTDLIEGGGGNTTLDGVNYEGSVQALNPSTGQPLWQTGLPGYVVGSPTEDGAGVVAAQVFGADSNNDLGVYLLNASTGQIIGVIPTQGSALFGQAVFTGNDLLVAGNQGVGLSDYEITAPGAPITAVSPSTLATGSTTTVTLTGTGFTGTPKVFVSGTGVTQAATATVVSPTTLSVSLTTLRSAATGYRNVTVIEPGSAPGSTQLVARTCISCLTIGSPPPPPTATAASPSSLDAGEQAVPLTISGTNFDDGAQVSAPAGVTVTNPVFVTSGWFDVTVSAAPTVAPGSYNLEVTNPDGTAAPCTGCLTVTSDPTPTLGAVSPATVGQGASYTFTLSGTGFVSGATVSFSSPGITVGTATDVNSTTLTVTARVTDGATVGADSVTVTTPGGSSTCTGCLTVDPGPSVSGVTSLTPGATTVATVTGSGFVSGLTVATNIPGASIGAITGVTSGSFQVSITVPSTAAVKNSYTLLVTNPDGGQGTFTHLSVT